MILIEKDGGRQLVESLEGYDGWTVIEKGVELPPSDHCERVAGQWVEDETAKAEAERLGSLATMSRADLVAMIEDLIGKQAARVDKLTSEVEAVAVAVDPTLLDASIENGSKLSA